MAFWAEIGLSWLISMDGGHPCIDDEVKVEIDRPLRRFLPPGPVEQFDLCQAFADHGGKEQAKEYTANQHIVIVILKYIKLFGGINSGLVDVKSVCNHL